MLVPDRTIHTTCPYCGVGCQIDLHIKDDLILRVDGRYDNHVNRGNLCVKGRFGLDFVHAPDRLTRPLIRRAGKGGKLQAESNLSSFTPVSWARALNAVAGRLDQIREQYGPDAIAVLTSAKCTNEENYLLQKFARAAIGTNTIDHCARL